MQDLYTYGQGTDLELDPNAVVFVLRDDSYVETPVQALQTGDQYVLTMDRQIRVPKMKECITYQLENGISILQGTVGEHDESTPFEMTFYRGMNTLGRIITTEETIVDDYKCMMRYIIDKDSTEEM
jgi:hypothetical protein